MFLDKNGCEIRVGDVIASPRWLGEKHVTVTAIDRFIHTDDGVNWERGAHFEILGRAFTPSPHVAPSPPATDERPILGKDRDGRDVRKGDRVRCGCKAKSEEFCPIGLLDCHHSDAGEPVTSARYGSCLGFDGGYVLGQDRAVLVTAAPQAEPTGRAVAIHSDIRAAAFPAQPIHRLCPACGERQPGAECQAPACRQIAKCVAARKTEEATRAAYVRFDATVRRVVAEEAPGVRVVTDYTTANITRPLVARVDDGPVRLTYRATLADRDATTEGALRAMLHEAQRALGAKAMGAKR